MPNKVVRLLRRPEAIIMGIVNVTPDSFSDGGRYLDVEQAVQHGLKMAEEGAEILDVGGESTRPGASSVSVQQELDRVIPVIEKLIQETTVPVSIDTYKAEVMSAAVAAGASMINDVKALQSNHAQDVAAELQVPVCLMHMEGEPASMQKAPHYPNVVTDVMAFLHKRVNSCVQQGIDKDNIIVDPGIGFGKTLAHNLQLLAAVPALKNDGLEVLVGVSRKSMIDGLLGRDVTKRLAASLGLAVQAVLNGAKIVRVHDVLETSDAVRSVEAVSQYQHKQ